jgi:enoyl-CoA hydratase
MIEYGAVSAVEHDGILHAAMRGASANALRAELLSDLAVLFERFATGRARVLVLSSELAGVFAGGGGIGNGFGSRSVEDIADESDLLRRPLERLASCGRPSIAVVDGRATGPGLELAMACTLRFCSTTSLFSFPDVRIGLIPGAGGTQRLTRLVGHGRSLELLLSGREIGAAEALSAGLVQRVYESDVLERSLEAAVTLAHGSARAIEVILSCVDAAHDLSHEQGLAVERAALLATLEDAV